MIGDPQSAQRQTPSPAQQQWTYPYYYQPQPRPQSWGDEEKKRWAAEMKKLLKQLGTACSLSLFIYLVLAVIVMLIMTSEIVDNLFSRTDYLFIMIPFPTPIISISGTALVLFYLFLAGTITISYLLLMGKSIKKTLKEMIDGKPGKHSEILTLGGLFFAMLVFNMIYYMLLRTGGAAPNVPDYETMPLWLMIYNFADASVWEEIISRVLLIGVPLLWIDLLFRREALKSPKRYFVGGNLNLGAVEIGLIIFSALMFGLAHAPGWDFWKVPPSILVGFCFGYIFIRIGFFAAVMFHFAFNFLSIPLTYLNATSSPLFGLMTIIWLLAGGMFFVYYSMKVVRFFRDAYERWTKARDPQYPAELGRT